MNSPAKVVEVTAADLLGGGTPSRAPAVADVEALPQPPAETPPAPTMPAPNPFAGQFDSLKREFHPAKFRLKDGAPQVDKLGRFVPLGLGRGGSSSNAETGAAPKPPPSFIPPDEPAATAPSAMPIDQMAAEVAINLVQTALILIGQDEGVLTDFERKTLHGPLSRILSKYNLGDRMTPELEFAAALAVIVMARMQKPKTMGWVQGKLADLRNWWTRRKLGAAVTPISHTPATPGEAAAVDYLRRKA